MSDIWAGIADVGDLLTITAIAPFLLGMGILVIKAGLFGSSPSMGEQAVRLLVGGLLALVPLSAGGVFIHLFFQFAEEMA